MVIASGGIGGGVASSFMLEAFCSMAQRRAAMRSKVWSGRNLA